MGRFNVFSPKNIEVAVDIQRGSFLPTRVTEAVARNLEEEGRQAMIDRAKAGELPATPDGRGTASSEYSSVDNSFPMTRIGASSPTRKNRYEARMGRVQALASQRSSDVRSWKSRNGNPWVYVKGGYRRFRGLAGLQNDRVSLSFTGKLHDDLRVKSVFRPVKNEKRASMMIAGGVGGTSGRAKQIRSQFDLSNEIGSIELKIGFATQSSWRIAKWQSERYGNHLPVWTPNDVRALRRSAMERLRNARSKYGGDSPGFAPRGASGKFIPIDL